MGNSLNSFVFQPPRPSYVRNDPHLHMVPTRQGHYIAAYFVRHRAAKFTVIFSHGNSEDIGSVLHCLMFKIAQWKANVFLYDYSGYGLSQGSPSEKNVYFDAEGAYDYLTKVIGVKGETVISFGRSIGSGPAIHLALNRKVAGLVLQCPVASIYRIKIRHMPYSLPGDLFRNIDKVHKLSVPTLILHGTSDEIVPISCSMQMATKIPEVYCSWIKGAKHNDMDVKYGQYVDQALYEFFSKVFPAIPVRRKCGYV
ncbi:alpha/beta hydrolase domain-containing protein [Babesia gibsoni]|uniref:Alpha/beta hydrolase domain-containing protein n=1 Tax=Babesia gibsoni TaxID=33632 RepID=A0AAD8LP11_BABGI|nr:alpha/beta hydrolase domain-containing protein [Babesia gibsoni]